MFHHCTIFLIFIIPITEACMAMIPPDDMEFSSTMSAPTSADPTDEESTTAEVEVTTTADGGGREVTDEPSPTTIDGGGGEVTAPSTTAAEEMCGECDVNAIAPTTDPENTRFVSQVRDPVDGCLRTYVICQRTDDLICDTVLMTAESASGPQSITDLTSDISVSATLSCDSDGTYSWGSVKMITQLTCSFFDCI